MGFPVLGASDAGLRARAGFEASFGDRLAAAYAGAVGALAEPAQRLVQTGDLPAGGLQHGGELRPFVRDGAALRIVLVIGVRRPRSLEEAAQVLLQRHRFGLGPA